MPSPTTENRSYKRRSVIVQESKRLVSRGHPPGTTRLHYAATLGLTDLLLHALSRGDNTEAYDSIGLTPLHIAAESTLPAAPEIARLLIAAGANIHAKTTKSHGEDRIHYNGKGEDTALHLAIRKDNVAVATALLDAGADLHAQNLDRKTPLGLLVYRGTYTHKGLSPELEQIACHACERTGSIDELKFEKRALLYLALKHNRVAFAEQLLDSFCDPNSIPVTESGGDYDTDAMKAPILFSALKRRNFPIASLLLRSGADPRVCGNYLYKGGWKYTTRGQDTTKVTALHVAAQEVGTAHLELLTQLLDRGADVNARDSNEETPIFYAVRNNAFAADAVKLLLSRGADTSLESTSGKTPLLLLLDYNKPYSRATSLYREVFKLLISSECNVNARDHLGRTALLLAAEFPAGGASVDIEALLDAGADASLASQKNETALIMVARRDLATFKPHVTELGREFERYEWLRRLIRGSAVDAQDDRGRTALHYAAERNDTTMIRMLLDADARRDITDSNGDTPLALSLDETYSQDSISLSLLGSSATAQDLIRQRASGVRKARLELFELQKYRPADFKRECKKPEEDRADEFRRLREEEDVERRKLQEAYEAERKERRQRESRQREKASALSDSYSYSYDSHDRCSGGDSGGHGGGSDGCDGW